tara:strand:- start:1087 stop:1461 length:375 start_codon:yes stop_codon:yes gene_type:complete
MIKQYELDQTHVPRRNPSTQRTLYESLTGKCPLYLFPGVRKVGKDSNYFQHEKARFVVIPDDKLLIGAEKPEDFQRTESLLKKICFQKGFPITESKLTLQAFSEEFVGKFVEQFTGQVSEEVSA